MKYEEAIKAVGGCGRYQIFMLNLLYIASVFNGAQTGSMIFIVPEIKHRCALPGLANDTYEIHSEAHAELVRKYIPQEMVDGKPVYSKCHLCTNKTESGNQTLSNCTSWVYDKSIFETSVTSDFNLVCEKEWLTKQVYTVFFAGYLVAMLLCGWLSDRLGRKTVIIGALMLQGLAGVLSTQTLNIELYLILRFLIAAGGAGAYIPSVVFGSELSSMKNRTSASMAIQLHFTLGCFVLNFLVYYIRTWAPVTLLVSVPAIPAALLYIWVLPESPRWLLTMKKDKEAETILNNIAKINKRDFKCTPGEIKVSVSKDRAARLWKIFTIPKLLRRTVLLMFNWCSVSFVYFGLMLNTEHLSGNIFLNFFLGTLVEVPAYVMCIVILNRTGRKSLFIAFMIIGGISGIMTIFPYMYAPDDLLWTTTALAILSKLCVTGCFGIIYLYTCELYPTCVRNGALGAHSTFARVGGVVAPYIMLMRDLAHGRLGDSLPLLTMGFVCIIASISYCFLPETCNKPMHDTFEDICDQQPEDLSDNEEDEFLADSHVALKPRA